MGWNIPKKPFHFKEPFLHNSLLRMDTCKGHIGTTKFTTGIQRLEAVEPGAAAHMSLHLN